MAAFELHPSPSPSAMATAQDPSEPEVLSLNLMFRYLYWAAVTVVVYDHVTTLGLEFQLMWKKWTFLEFLFISNRYVGTILAIVYLLPSSLTTKTCSAKEHVAEWATFFVIWTMQGIMQYRIYAMYQNSRKVLIFLVSGFIIEAICMLTIMIVSTWGVDAHPVKFVDLGIVLCLNTIPESRNMIYIPAILYESVLFGFALRAGIRFYNGRRDYYTSEIQSAPLAFILMRDSIVFPFITVNVCLAYTIIMFSDVSDVTIGVLRSLPGIVCCILGSRLVLHLREAFYLPFTGEMGQATRLEDDG